MKWICFSAYRLLRLMSRILFDLAHKIQWLSWKFADKANSGGLYRSTRKPLTAVWKIWKKLTRSVG